MINRFDLCIIIGIIVMKIRYALALLFFIYAAQSTVVIDMAGNFTNFTCFKNANYSHVIIRSYHSYGAIDLDAKKNILLSNAAGLSTDTYMFPCRGKDPATQVK